MCLHRRADNSIDPPPPESVSPLPSPSNPSPRTKMFPSWKFVPLRGSPSPPFAQNPLPDISLPFQCPLAAEIDENTDSESRGLQVIENLGLLIPRKTPDRLQLDDDLPIANQVGIILRGQAPTLIANFLFRPQKGPRAQRAQLHSLLIHSFKKPRPQHAMSSIAPSIVNQFPHSIPSKIPPNKEVSFVEIRAPSWISIPPFRAKPPT